MENLPEPNTAQPERRSALEHLADEVRAACEAEFAAARETADTPSGAKSYRIVWRSRVHRPFEPATTLETRHWLTPAVARNIRERRLKAHLASALALTLCVCVALGVAGLYAMFMLHPEALDRRLLAALTAVFPLIAIGSWSLSRKTQTWGIPTAWRERFALFLIYEIREESA